MTPPLQPHPIRQSPVIPHAGWRQLVKGARSKVKGSPPVPLHQRRPFHLPPPATCRKAASPASVSVRVGPCWSVLVRVAVPAASAAYRVALPPIVHSRNHAITQFPLALRPKDVAARARILQNEGFPRQNKRPNFAMMARRGRTSLDKYPRGSFSTRQRVKGGPSFCRLVLQNPCPPLPPPTTHTANHLTPSPTTAP